MVAPWVQRATGTPGGMVADAAEVRRAVQVFADPDPASGFQIVSLPSGRSTVLPGCDPEGGATGAASLPAGFGVYFQVNPVRPGLTKKAAVRDVLRRRWLFVDVDPVRDEAHKDEPATDAEKARTRDVCDDVNEFLVSRGWPAPVITDSGNGYGLFYPCDLPNDAVTRAYYKRLLALLDERFSGPDGRVDAAVFNADRLAKLPGTWAKKGQQSDDRPHRPCRLVFVPEPGQDPVTAEMLADVAGPVPAADPPKAPPQNGYDNPFRKRASNKSDAAYANAALDRECARVTLAKPGAAGGRNNALNRAAFALGQLVAGGLLSEALVVDRLYEAACRSGLDEDKDCGPAGIRSTIQSGLTAGKQLPRTPPERKPGSAPTPSANGKPDPQPDDGTPLTVRLSDVERKTVEWLVPNRIPKRFITVFAGRTGVGKSFTSCDLIARLSVGGEIPLCGGLCFEPGGTLILSEDPVDYVIAPRLIEAGANMDRIHAMTWDAMSKFHLGDTAMLERAVNEVAGGVKLVMIDPPTNFTEGIDEHKNSEVRQLVMKVVQWLSERDMAVLFILHVNKAQGKGVEAINRVMGSVAWVTTARIAHSFCPDPTDPDRCLWVPLKNNLGPAGKAIAYRIASTDGLAKVEWLEEVDTTAEEAMGGPPPRQRRDLVAADWLVDRFREKREWKSDDLMDAGRQERISRDAIFEAKRTLKLPRARKQTQENGDVVWVWWVPEDWPPLVDDEDEQEQES